MLNRRKNPEQYKHRRAVVMRKDQETNSVWPERVYIYEMFYQEPTNEHYFFCIPLWSYSKDEKLSVMIDSGFVVTYADVYENMTAYIKARIPAVKQEIAKICSTIRDLERVTSDELVEKTRSIQKVTSEALAEIPEGTMKLNDNLRDRLQSMFTRANGILKEYNASIEKYQDEWKRLNDMRNDLNFELMRLTRKMISKEAHARYNENHGLTPKMHKRGRKKPVQEQFKGDTNATS